MSDGLTEELAIFEDPRTQCFLCARPLSVYGQTAEHVVPQWAQRRYELWNQQLVLLNSTALPYRQLTVPCCDECNRYRLKPIEDLMSQSVEIGRDAVVALGSKVLFLWLGKIFYGILYRELMLRADLRDPAAGPIVPEEMIRAYSTHRLFLQQARALVDLQDFEPGSIFVFNAQPLPERRLEWDIADNVHSLFAFVRVGKVALLGALGDGGAQQYEEEIYKSLYPLELHPLQLRELCARIAYRSLCATRVPKYFSQLGTPRRVWQLPLGGLSSKPLFEDFDSEVYAQVLSHYTGYPLEAVFQAPSKTMSWLQDEHGNPRLMPFRDFPALPPALTV